MFNQLYDRVLQWSSHPRAPAYLSVLSFAESSFFPIPPDVMLGPMCLAKPLKAFRYALLCTVSSVLGGLAGYLIGRLAFSSIEAWLMASHYAPAFDQAVNAFEQYGIWYILIAGFSPIPYKVFTVGAGAFGMPVLPFVLGSLAGRGGRFFLVAGLIRLGGPKMAEKLREWVDFIGWAVVALLVVGFFVWKFSGWGQ